MTEISLDTTYSGGRDPPALDGFKDDDGKWRLELSGYEQFIEDVTGISISDDISPQEMKTIQTRLEGCIASYKRSGECLCDNLQDYEHLSSMESVHELSRFFRVLVATHVEESPPI